MMRLLMDTLAYSAFMRGHANIRDAVRTNEEIFLNSVVVGELTASFIKGSGRRKNEAELRRFLASPRVGLVDVTGKRRKDTLSSSMVYGKLGRRSRPTISDRGKRHGIWI